jgi:hypothetical protein
MMHIPHALPEKAVLPAGLEFAVVAVFLPSALCVNIFGFLPSITFFISNNSSLKQDSNEWVIIVSYMYKDICTMQILLLFVIQDITAVLTILPSSL